jgi:hypothetical protein
LYAHRGWAHLILMLSRCRMQGAISYILYHGACGMVSMQLQRDVIQRKSQRRWSTIICTQIEDIFLILINVDRVKLLSCLIFLLSSLTITSKSCALTSNSITLRVAKKLKMKLL